MKRGAMTARRQDTVLFVLAALVLALPAPRVGAEEGGKRDEHRGAASAQRSEPHRNPAHRDRDRHGYAQGNYYPQPFYAPPPVVYVAPQSPGISLFVPLEIRLR